ncbi:MAG: CocE/NonD family hydrolase [Solirubrobacterales bacterium]|nr:CocE/NonD family hydrolase [Solirubrobacterales bacterium]
MTSGAKLLIGGLFGAVCLACFVCPALAGAATLSAHGSVDQVWVVGARPGQRVTLFDPHGRAVSVRAAGPLGGVVFRGVAPGNGYRVATGRLPASSRLSVLPDRSAPPSTRIYGQRIVRSGYGYVTVRDGIKLAIDVRLPAGPGPYPTLVEYSGYGYADPAGAQSGIAPIANLLGFAVVDVNMRGTGCSGGAFSFFEPLQSLDGYDVIETVAHQPWVLGHRVGMIGISYGGISQLFVAATDPPHLAAIAPMSVIDDIATTLYPGGILNTGFALPFARARDIDAEAAAPGRGEAWALNRIRGGDEVCAANQALHPEAVSEVAEVYANRYYVPSAAGPLDPNTFIGRIRVPVYLACQWTDEQTGGHCPELAEHFTGTRLKWFTFTNGVHVDSLDPLTALRWYDFLSLFVAHRLPALSPVVRALAPELYQVAMGVSGVSFPADDPIEDQGSYAAALAAFERLPSVRILFDNGAARGSRAGVPGASFEQSFARWPIPGTRPMSWYLGSGGALLPGVTRLGGVDRFTWDPSARPPTDFSANTGPGGLWGVSPRYHWREPPRGTALSYLSAPLASDTAVVGAGSAQLWIAASTRDVDLQLTVSEVRPDGRETYVQSGWLRASERKLAPGSTLLQPALTLRRSDVAPLRPGRFTQVVVPLYYEGHVYRAGSRIRITISAPGADQPIWAFADLVPEHRATVRVAHSKAMASRLVLPVVPGVVVPTGLPPCPGLRGEPCRRYVPLAN